MTRFLRWLFRPDDWRRRDCGHSHTAIGWQASVSQRVNKAEEHPNRERPVSLVGDFGGQFSTLDNGKRSARLRVSGWRARARGQNEDWRWGGRRVDPLSVFAHALFGGTTRSVGTRSDTGFMMGYGGGVDLLPGSAGAAYALGARAQFDWLPPRINGAWTNGQFRITVGVVWSVRYWD